MTPEDALKHPWMQELKKRSSKDTRPKHRLRRDGENSAEQDNTRKRIYFFFEFLIKD
jgi:hypothetical protein